MTDDKGILIQNIYYMLCYAYQALKPEDYREIAGEGFENVYDLFAAILKLGVSRQIKQGLYREYADRQEALAIMRGRLDMAQTARLMARCEKKLACEFDELSANNAYNRILKTTMHFLIAASDVKSENKKDLTKLMRYFEAVEFIEPAAVRWDRLRYQRNNRTYEMLVNICRFVLCDMLQTTEDGKYKMKAFSDEHMEKLYEKFILEFYKKERKDLAEARAARIPWNLTAACEPEAKSLLPAMQTDVCLRKNGKTLIIDAKYYRKTMQKQYDKSSLYSSHIYQIFSYVKNEDRNFSGNVSGLLLYAKTREDAVPDCSFEICGSNISVKTLDLNTDFDNIKAQLCGIADACFG